jgi:predicted dienelactone hydrolase
MRPLEITLLLLSILVLTWCLAARGRPAWVRALASVALVIMVIQIVVEGRRWQMWPGYLVTVWLFLALICKRVTRPGFWTSLAGMGGSTVSAAMCTVLPVFEFPTPTGPYPVGTVTRHLIDPSREEISGPIRGARRELMVQFWYPADSHGPRKTYRSRGELSLFKEHLSLIMTNASAGIPVARSPGRYPVLIFDHSWAGRRDEDTFLVENLASHGYVVVGIDHPYSSKFTAFPDGRIIYSTLGEWMDFSSDEAMQASLRINETQAKIRVQDASFVLDTLERLDRFDPGGLFAAHLDTTRAGIVGFSFGGAVAAEACRLDPRFGACVDLDGCLFGESAKEGVERPFLVMSNDGSVTSSRHAAKSSGPKQRRLAFNSHADRDVLHSFQINGGYAVNIKGVTHMNFCDAPLFIPIRRMNEAGPIDPRCAMRIINAFALSFFDQYLGMQPRRPLSRAAREYPEARLTTYGCQSKDTNAHAPDRNQESFPFVR